MGEIKQLLFTLTLFLAFLTVGTDGFGTNMQSKFTKPICVIMLLHLYYVFIIIN